MHILSLSSPISLGDNSVILPGDYVVDDVAGAQLLAYSGEGEMNRFKLERLFDERVDWNGKRILLMRMGGFGDLLMMTPLMREIGRRWPLAKVDVCCNSEFAQAIMNLPYVNKVIPAPVPLETLLTEYDCWIPLENVLERGPNIKKFHAVDLIAKRAGLTGLDNRQLDYRVTEHERIWAEQAFPRVSSQRRVCIQISANSYHRTFSREKTGQICAAMIKKGWEVFVMAKPGEVKLEDRPGLRIVISGFSFRQRCAVIETADCVLGPDSSLVHVAGALGVPCIALYGPTDWRNRTKYAPKTSALTGVGGCAPCHHIATHANNQFPPNCPSASKGHCQVLDSIDVGRIVARIEENARRFRLTPLE